MKQTFILTMVASFIAATLFTSCHPSRVWATKKKEPKEYREREYREREVYNRPTPPPPPPTYARVTLVLNPYPGFVMRQSPDGRYYHRSQQGFTYWKGYDNRFYLDRRDIRNVSYTRGDYEEWRRGTP